MPGWIYVNSTIGARRQMIRDELSPLHWWGYRPDENDQLMVHRTNRWEVHARARLGFDPRLLWQTTRALRRGMRRLYLVTQPDLIVTLPWLKRRWPDLCAVTWVWNAQECHKWRRPLHACRAIFSLTEGGLDGLRAIGLHERSSLQIWGGDPQCFQLPQNPVVDIDALFLGLTARDVQLLRRWSPPSSWRLVTATKLRHHFVDACARWHTEPVDKHADLLRLLYRSRVALVPLLQNDPYPTGYTNLIEALLCGTRVVIGDTSSIPRAVLSLRGVHLYRTGSVDSFAQAVEEARAAASRNGDREMIRAEASLVLHARGIHEALSALN